MAGGRPRARPAVAQGAGAGAGRGGGGARRATCCTVYGNIQVQ